MFDPRDEARDRDGREDGRERVYDDRDRDDDPRMKAALELGRWTFPAPLGYLNAPKWSNASLVHDPERAPLARQAFEDLATGQYTKQEVIARATSVGLRSKEGLTLSPQSFGQMMRNPIYAGKVESPEYGVSTRGNFEPLIDEAMFYRAQAVLDGPNTVREARLAHGTIGCNRLLARLRHLINWAIAEGCSTRARSSGEA